LSYKKVHKNPPFDKTIKCADFQPSALNIAASWVCESLGFDLQSW